MGIVSYLGPTDVKPWLFFLGLTIFISLALSSQLYSRCTEVLWQAHLARATYRPTVACLECAAEALSCFIE